MSKSLNEKAKIMRREGTILNNQGEETSLGFYSIITVVHYGQAHEIHMRNGEVIAIREAN